MEWSSVVTTLRRHVAITRQRHTVALIAAVLALSPVACGDSNGPTSPSGNSTQSDTAQTGLVEGTVRDTSGAVPGTLVEVTGAPGGSATTNSAGVFSFRLPVGITRLRLSKSGYYPQESDVVVKVGTTASLNVFLEKTSASPPQPQAPYTVKGAVRNARGAIVSGAEVWIYGNNSPIDNRYGTTTTDSGGRYSVSSAQRIPQTVRALKDGHIPRDVSILSLPDASSTWTVDVVLVHIDRYAIAPLPALTVGQTARLETQMDLDDGSTKSGFLYMVLTTSDPSVLQVQPNGWVQGITPGAATVTASYYGATTTLRVRVDP